MKKIYKDVEYEFIDVLKVKHLKELMRLGHGNLENPFDNDELLEYMVSNFVVSPKIEDVEELDADVFVFIMDTLDELQEPLMEFDVIKKKLQK